jgi:6-pyruvoyltetrahydropterin/6-carboxytetrahydropterin synthase
MHKIKKTFHLAYGHRLLNHKGKCANLHGHNGVVEVTLKAAKLNSDNMVMDFTELGVKVKTWLDANLDHKVILAKTDPLAAILDKAGQACFLTSDSPTAEILARLLFERFTRDLKLPVDKVAFWETPASMASYSED